MAFGGTENPYGDVPKSSYSYDDRVQNHKQVAVGDLLFVRSQTVLDGVGRIERIQEGSAKKRFLKCPICQNGRVHERVGMKPRYKCKSGHEFAEPAITEAHVRTFRASFDGFWLDAGPGISIHELRPFELRDSKQLAIMPADTQGLLQYIARRNPRLGIELRAWIGESTGNLTDQDADESIDLTPKGADERQRIMRSIRLRRGQANFRDALISRYQAKCVISGCQVLGVLEAAHIRAYRGPRDNHPGNGLLLRSDLHTLFDLDRIAIDPESMTLVIDKELENSEYGQLAGRRLFETTRKPDRAALVERWGSFLKERSQ
jgi:hypothetical protein